MKAIKRVLSEIINWPGDILLALFVFSILSWVFWEFVFWVSSFIDIGIK